MHRINKRESVCSPETTTPADLAAAASITRLPAAGPTNDPDGSPEGAVAGRRRFLLTGLSAGLGIVLAGCGVQRTTSTLPGPSWRVRQETVTPNERPLPHSPRTPPNVDSGTVISRASWSPGTASPGDMRQMNGVRYITIHHDGIGPFYDFDERASRQRLESIRRYHRNELGWGDIGYHYIIDRNGRIWEGRSITYQGAHVGNHNEHNIGVLLMGHFDQQSPSNRQLAVMQQYVSTLMRRYNIPIGNVTTHREWVTARTVCPGHTLQSHMDHIRRRNMLG